MSARMVVFFLAVLVLPPFGHAKNKKKQVLPDYVLRAQTVLVVIHPDPGEPVTDPLANRTARDNVEKALMKWGRFRLVTDARSTTWDKSVRVLFAEADDEPLGMLTLQNSEEGLFCK